jgi:hypothetical protein
LFATRRYRTYETHKLPNGEILLIGFVTAEEARHLSIATTDVQVRVQPEPEPGVESLVCISYSRIRQHRQFSVRNEHGLTITVAPTALQG